MKGALVFRVAAAGAQGLLRFGGLPGLVSWGCLLLLFKGLGLASSGFFEVLSVYGLGLLSLEGAWGGLFGFPGFRGLYIQGFTEGFWALASLCFLWVRWPCSRPP